MDAQQIHEEWEAALDDAGLTSEQCVLLLSDRPPTEKGRGAQWFQPGMTIQADDDDLVTEELAEEANSLENRDRHRIVVRRTLANDPVSVAGFSGKLRHELEHARQWDACGLPAFQLNELADWVLTPKLRGIPRGSIFTNLKPVEQDANAASAMFLLARWPDEVTLLLDDPDNAPLVRSLTPPGSFDTLVTRMIAFLYIYEELCAALEARYKWAISFADHLDGIALGAGALWKTLGKFGAPPTTGGEPPADTAWGHGYEAQP